MGSWISNLFNGIKQYRIIMIGLDSSGKTSILYKLNMGEIVDSVPTIGFNVETIKYKYLVMNVWDIGGQSKIRKLWHHYYEGTDAIIFVIDSSDHERFTGTESVNEEIKNICMEDKLKGRPLLVFSNKSDLDTSRPLYEVISKTGLNDIKDRPVKYVSTSIYNMDGIYTGLDWLSTILKKI